MPRFVVTSGRVCGSRRAQHVEPNVLRGKCLRKLAETQTLQPMRDIVHRGATGGRRIVAGGDPRWAPAGGLGRTQTIAGC